MNNDEKVLVNLLGAAISEESICKSQINCVNWNNVYEMSKEQDICSLLYPVIKNINDNLKPDNEIMSKWKKNTILTSLKQINNNKRICFVLKILNKCGIEVMGLKGLVIREYYPIKELRSMVDTDILIHVNDLEKTKKILLSLGYVEKNRNSKHILFLHKYFMSIEVHWLLLDVDRFKNGDFMEKIIWENTKRFNINGAYILVPLLENQILHLCFHLASHFIYSGFGLRQLCDLVIIVKTQGKKINWNSFFEKVKICKIKNFVIAIFEVCRKLFNMKVPQVLYSDMINDKYIDMIIDSVFNGGVYGGIYGRVSMGPVDNNLLTYYEKHKQNNDIIAKLKYIIEFIFPTPRRLSNRYNYAKRYPILIPIAWTHRLIYGVFRKDFNVKQKKLLLLWDSDFFKRRIDLFEWLEL